MDPDRALTLDTQPVEFQNVPDSYLVPEQLLDQSIGLMNRAIPNPVSRMVMDAINQSNPPDVLQDIDPEQPFQDPANPLEDARDTESSYDLEQPDQNIPSGRRADAVETSPVEKAIESAMEMTPA